MRKPDTCLSCPLTIARGSTGFVADLDQGGELIQLALPTLFAIVVRFPTRDDIANGELMTSRGARYWEREFLAPLGIRREQVIFSNAIRCYPNGGEFPTGPIRKAAMKYCRRYDAAIERFDPNIIGVTIAPSMLLKVPNLATFFRRDLERAKEFAEAGYRPLILAGEEAKEVYAAHLDGGVKKWRGHWEERKLR